jgi:hypothetical protein
MVAAFDRSRLQDLFKIVLCQVVSRYFNLFKTFIFFNFNALDSITTQERAAHMRVPMDESNTNLRGDILSKISISVC